MSLDDLRSDFQIVKGQFAAAATIEEKLRLVAISQRIITAAHAEIDVFKSGLAARMILVGTLMTASDKKWRSFSPPQDKRVVRMNERTPPGANKADGSDVTTTLTKIVYGNPLYPTHSRTSRP